MTFRPSRKTPAWVWSLPPDGLPDHPQDGVRPEREGADPDALVDTVGALPELRAIVLRRRRLETVGDSPQLAREATVRHAGHQHGQDRHSRRQLVQRLLDGPEELIIRGRPGRLGPLQLLYLHRREVQTRSP